MPNWCNTSYTFEGNKEEIADLYQKLQSLNELPEPLVENGFGKLWLGCVVTLFGGDWNKIECRGEIDDVIELDSETNLSFTTTTAWSEKTETWNFVTKQYTSIKYYFIAEEPSCAYYVKNDKQGKYFREKFIVQQDDGETEYITTEAELFKEIAKRMGINRITDKRMLRHALKKYNKDNADDNIYVDKFIIV